MDMGVLLVAAVVFLIIFWSYLDLFKAVLRLIASIFGFIFRPFRKKLRLGGENLSPLARKAINQLKQARSTDTFYRFLDEGGESVYRELAEQDLDLDQLRTFHVARPAHLWTAILLGNRLITHGWNIRTGKLASEVSDEQRRGFFQHLNEAEAVLTKVMEQNSSYYPAYTNLMQLYKGKGNSATAADVYQSAEARFPERMRHKVLRLHQLTQRWGGEENEALNYARSFLTQWDQPWKHALVAVAHIETALDMGSTKKYFSNEAVQTELEEQFKAYLKYSESKQPGKFPEALEALNHFAFCFYRTKNKKLLKQAMQLLGTHMSNFPWYILQGTLAEVFQDARKTAGLKPLPVHQ